jgi:hypothetical protein
MLDGLTPTELRAFTAICAYQTMDPGSIVLEAGNLTTRLYILVDGELEASWARGSATPVKPVAVVGDVESVTRRPLLATYTCMTLARLLTVEMHDFEALAYARPGFRAKVYQNLIRFLADQLSDAKDRVARFQRLADEGPGPAVVAPGALAVAAPAGVPGHGDGVTIDTAASQTPKLGERIELDDAAEHLLTEFYALVGFVPDEAGQVEDREHYAWLRRRGYSDADIEFAARWASRHIASIRRFNLVRLSIAEAFEGKWNG